MTQNTTSATAMPTASEIMMAQDRQDALINLYSKAATEQRRAEIKAEYDALQARCDMYFAARKK